MKNKEFGEDDVEEEVSERRLACFQVLTFRSQEQKSCMSSTYTAIESELMPQCRFSMARDSCQPR